MTVVGFLASMAREGGHLRVDGERLAYRGPESFLTAESRAFLREHRDAILAFLRKPVSGMTREELAAFDYRPSAEPWDESRQIPVTDEVIAGLQREEAARAAAILPGVAEGEQAPVRGPGATLPHCQLDFLDETAGARSDSPAPDPTPPRRRTPSRTNHKESA